MRTSGASHNDGLLVLMTVVTASAVIVMLLGGPREVMLHVENLTRSALSAVTGSFR